jgi:phytoene dehydrogenase-like protein
MRWRRISIDAFAKNFSNPRLRELFRTIFTDHEDFSMVAQLLTIGWYSQQHAGRPEGGSLTVRNNLQRRYEQLGGTLHLNAPVQSIEVKKGVACGLRLKDGAHIRGDYVISAADLHHTLNSLLAGGDRRHFDGYFKNLTPYPSFIDVNLGIDALLPEGIPHMVNYVAPVPITVGNGQTRTKIVSHFFVFDKSVAPEGKSVIMTHVRSHDFDFWHTLRQTDRERYNKEKSIIAQQIIAIVDKTFSSATFRIRDHIEVVDVATPASYYRWTNNYRGSYEGWIPAPNSVGVLLKKRVPGIKNFHLVGHWVEPGGGLPAVALSGRNVAQVLCKRDGKRFVTTMA